MDRINWTAALVVGGILLAAGVRTEVRAETPVEAAAKTPEKGGEAERSEAAPEKRPAPKELTENVKKGMAWLAKQQLPSGAWGQGEESQRMGQGGQGSLRDTPNVADTCMAAMALFRAGHTPTKGDYQPNIRKALDFVCGQVEESDGPSLFVTATRNTRTQGKLGTYIDTFLAAQLLAEMKGLMPDEAANKRVDDALAKVIKKIETNQKENGQWVNAGWAPTLAQAQCAKALNIASARGVKVDETVRERAEQFARADYAQSKAAGVSGVVGTGAVGLVVTDLALAARPAAAGAGDAGVKLYSSGAQIASMQASALANDKQKAYYLALLDSKDADGAAKKEAQEKLDRFGLNERDLLAAQADLVKNLGDQRFVAGFGSNGGEEFLSYLNIGESLYVKGGEAWGEWDKKIGENLNGVQNEDGSWSGHHCITGRTFCTSAALMVLTIDRAPMHPANKVEAK